jgi:hypothetical protein
MRHHRSGRGSATSFRALDSPYIGLAGLALGIERVEGKLDIVLGRFARITRPSHQIAHCSWQFMVQLEPTSENLARDLCGDVARPTFGGVEGHHAKGMSILAGQQIGDDRLQIGFCRVGLPVSVSSPKSSSTRRSSRLAHAMCRPGTHVTYNLGRSAVIIQ